VPDAPPPLRAFFDVIDARPRWLDEARLLEGARVCGISGMTGLRVLRDVALMGGYQSSAINRPLILTGALAGGTQRRLAETTKWWIDCTEPGGMARFASGFQSTVRVRLIHAIIRRHLRGHAEWDGARFGLPLNQTDMAATYLGFSVVFLLAQRRMGVPLTAPEGRAAMHLWRYIGWLMGVDERWLYDEEQQGRVALYQNILAQAPPDESSRALGRALMNEPLSRHYARWPWLRGRYERALGLSVSRLFLGRRGMRALGLPRFVLPWFPLLSAPLVFAGHWLARLLGGRGRLERRGRAAQVDYLPTLFGKAAPTLRGLHGPQQIDRPVDRTPS
jgi:mpaB/rubber oxygenase-like protein